MDGVPGSHQMTDRTGVIELETFYLLFPDLK